MSVKVVRQIKRSLYSLTLKPAGPQDICIICLRPGYVEYEGEIFCEKDGAERFSEEMFHAKVYAKTVGAHSNA